ncbi:MAG: site-specific integrase [Candidatus Methanomethylicus sp.]|nr:site-specific integrase [Candidatus Methanomethylicus sp.]
MTKKRGQGEGSIYQRKDGLWVAAVTIQGQRLCKYCKNQREALDWKQEMRSRIQSGLTSSGAQTRLGAYLEEWLTASVTTVRPKTHAQYTQIVRQHILPGLGNVKLQDLRPDQIQSLYNAKVKDGISPRTVLVIHAVLHRALNQALKWGLVGRNPAQAVTRPRLKRSEMKILTDIQSRTLLIEAKGSRLEVLLWLAISTGLRQGELLGLRWSDLDRRTCKLHIQRQLQRIKGGQVFSEPKSAAGKRAIVLGNAIIQKLREQAEAQQAERLAAGDTWQENDLIFPSVTGTPWDHSNMYKDFKMLLQQAGLPDIRFHDLRHTAATLMLQQGVHPKVVQERLGHADITLTLNTYSHVLPSMQEEAAAKMDELLKPIDISEEFKHIQERGAVYLVHDGPGEVDHG